RCSGEPPRACWSCRASEVRRGSFGFNLVEVPAIRVIGSTGALGGNHGGAKRSQRRAYGSKSRAIVRLFDSSENLATDADRRLFGIDFFDFEKALSIVVAILPTQLVAALGDPSDTAPFAICNLKDAVDQLSRGHVAFAVQDARVLVLDG